MSKLKDMTGDVFGRLTVIRRAENSKSGQARWLCKCSCGKETTVFGNDLRREHTTSCGCLVDEINTDHGMSTHHLYKVYYSMRGRCYNPDNRNYNRYGAKGVKLCDEWLNNPLAFIEWAKSQGYKYNSGVSVERVDNNGNYEPNNCIVTTMHVQSRNRCSNVNLTFDGRTQCQEDWARELGISATCIRKRLKRGWSVAKTLTTPSRRS